MNNIINEPYHTKIEKIDDLPKQVGKELGLSDWITIDQKDINSFAKLTHDEQWIHTDVERSANESPFGTTVAHGFMVLAFASKFTSETIKLPQIKMGVNYGLNKVRFMSPTPSGAQVRGRVSLLDAEMKEGCVKYTIKIIFELKGQEKPACVAEFLAMVFK